MHMGWLRKGWVDFDFLIENLKISSFPSLLDSGIHFSTPQSNTLFFRVEDKFIKTSKVTKLTKIRPSMKYPSHLWYMLRPILWSPYSIPVGSFHHHVAHSPAPKTSGQCRSTCRWMLPFWWLDPKIGWNKSSKMIICWLWKDKINPSGPHL